MTILQTTALDLGGLSRTLPGQVGAMGLLPDVNPPGFPPAATGGAVTLAAPITTTTDTYALLGYGWPSNSITWSIVNYNYTSDVTAGISFTHTLGPASEAVLQQAFHRWSEVSGLGFIQVPDSPDPGSAAGIRIGFADLPAIAPNQQVIGRTRIQSLGATILPNVTIQLEDPSIIPLYTAPGYPVFYWPYFVTLQQVMQHEIGHAVGIAHTTAPTDLMYPIASTANPDLSPDDVAAVRALYPSAAAGVEPPPRFAVTDTNLGVSHVAIGANYTGPVSYISDEYIYAGIDDIAVSTSLPNVFLHGGGGDDALFAASGHNVLDGGTGSNFLTGGSGTSTYFVDDRDAASDIWSTIVGFHQGDAATIWGVNTASFQLEWVDGQGAAGYTGLTFHATAPGRPTASMTVPGYTTADLTNGRLAFVSGHDPASGSDYMYLYAAS